MKKNVALLTVIFALVGALSMVASLLLRGSHLEQFRSDFNSGDLNKVIADAEEILRKDKDNVEALLAIATTYAMRGSVSFSEKENGTKAIEYADQALALDPTNSEAFRIKGYAYEIQELYPQAHENYDKAIGADPTNFQALSNKAHAYDLQGDWDKAEALYKQSLEVQPRGEHALLNIGRLYARKGKAEEAKTALEQLVATSPSIRFKAEGNQILAEILRGQEKYGEAKKAIEQATLLDPMVPQAWVSRGRIELGLYMQELGPPDAVIQSISGYAQKALQINPNQASAFVLLSDVALLANDTAKREDYKQRALAAIDRDITLGAAEKQSLREYLTTTVIVEDRGEVIQQGDGSQAQATPLP